MWKHYEALQVGASAAGLLIITFCFMVLAFSL